MYYFQVWDIRSGMCTQTFTGHESDINAVSVSLFKTYFDFLTQRGRICSTTKSFEQCDFFIVCLTIATLFSLSEYILIEYSCENNWIFIIEIIC